MSALAKASGALKSVDYEVFGRVQGVCFRMYTEEEARKLGVVGWVKNTSQGTVTGQVQGPEDKVNAIYFFHQLYRWNPVFHLLRRGINAMRKGMNLNINVLSVDNTEEHSSKKSWLSKVGSPSSRIDRTSFSNEKEISKLDFSGFSTRY